MMIIDGLIYTLALVGGVFLVVSFVLIGKHLLSEFVAAHTEGLEFRIARQGGAITQAQLDIDNVRSDTKHFAQAVTELEDRVGMIERTLAA